MGSSVTLAFWTAGACIMLSFGFVLGWVARGAVVALDQPDIDGTEATIIDFPERPGA
jgi:hypothetical protein